MIRWGPLHPQLEESSVLSVCRPLGCQLAEVSAVSVAVLVLQ